tara:strand:+ start:321 stop:503 length:183 start_codon:yes stop_codon:yes gene_type:complete
MVKELTIKDAIIDHYKKPYDKITKEEKHKFLSLINPFYDVLNNYDLNEEEKNQVVRAVNG